MTHSPTIIDPLDGLSDKNQRRCRIPILQSCLKRFCSFLQGFVVILQFLDIRQVVLDIGLSFGYLLDHFGFIFNRSADFRFNQFFQSQTVVKFA